MMKIGQQVTEYFVFCLICNTCCGFAYTVNIYHTKIIKKHMHNIQSPENKMQTILVSISICNFFLFQVKQEDIFRFVTEGILLTLVSTFGLIGNCMSIIVLTRASGVVRQGGASFSKLLRGLATFDALFLIIAIISFGFPQLSRWYSKNVFLYIMPIVFGLLHTFRVGSVYVTLAVTFERFHAIICPLKHFFWKKYLLPVSVFIAVFYNIPKYFEMEMQVRVNMLKYFKLSLSKLQ